MNSLQPGILIMSYSLGWALIHSLWQALLVYGGLRITLGILSNASARLRYNLSFLALCGICAWFLYTWLANWMYLSTAVQSGMGTNQIIHTAGVWTKDNLYRDVVLQLQTWLPLVANLYIAGVALLAGRLLYNYLQLQSCKKRGTSPATTDWMDKLNDYKSTLRIPGSVRLLFSEYISVPMVTGFIKPLILLPVATMACLSTEQLEAILVHELAHIKRNDYLLNMIQVVMETVLFFNPFARIISAGIRIEREHCCDDVVLEHSTQPLLYAQALAALETQGQRPLVLAAAGNKKLLFNRIKRIMEMKKRTLSHPAASVVLVAGLVISLVWLTPVVAQTRKNEKPSGNTTTHTTTKERITITDNNGNKRVYHSMKDVPEKDRKAMAAPPEPPEPPEAPEPPEPSEAIAPVPPVPPVDRIDIDHITDSAVAIAMKNANKAIDVANISLDAANKALSEIDWKEINEAIKQAGEEANAALKNVDWKQVNAEISKAQKEAMKEAKEANREAAKARQQAARHAR